MKKFNDIRYDRFQSHIGLQQGAALFVSLIILLILTIIGLSASQRGHLQERVAGNTHVRNMLFNSAESAVGGFLVEANTGNRSDPSHMLYTLRIEGSLNNMCYNQLGQRAPCDGSVYLDGDKGAGAIASSLDVIVVEDCNTQMCSGFSLGQAGGGYGCRIFRADGVGSMGSFSGGTPTGQQASTTLWAYEVTACVN